MRVGDRLAEIFFDGGEMRDHVFDHRAVDAGQHIRHHVVGEDVELFQHRARRRRQEQSLGAPVVGVAAPFDQAVVAQPVDQPGQGDRLEVENFRELGLLEAFVALEPEQHRPLRPGHAELPGLLVGAGAQQPGYVTEKKRRNRVRAGNSSCCLILSTYIISMPY